MYSFLDIGPLSKGHALIIPKCACYSYTPPPKQLLIRGADHAEKLHEVPDEYLQATLPVAKKLALAIGAENYNVLQVRF